MKKLHLTAAMTAVATSAHAHGHTVAVDAILLSTVTVTTGAITWILAAIDPNGFNEELRHLLLPLIGSMISCAGMFLFNTVAEHRRIVAGRTVFALLFGCMTPSVSGFFSTNIQEFFSHAVPLFAGGSVFSIFYYVLSYTAAKKFYAKADAIIDKAEDKVDEFLHIKGESES